MVNPENISLRKTNMNSHPALSYEVCTNFFFGGQNFWHKLEISALLSAKMLSDKVSAKDFVRFWFFTGISKYFKWFFPPPAHYFCISVTLGRTVQLPRSPIVLRQQFLQLQLSSSLRWVPYMSSVAVQPSGIIMSDLLTVYMFLSMAH